MASQANVTPEQQEQFIPKGKPQTNPGAAATASSGGVPSLFATEGTFSSVASKKGSSSSAPDANGLTPDQQQQHIPSAAKQGNTAAGDYNGVRPEDQQQNIPSSGTSSSATATKTSSTAAPGVPSLFATDDAFSSVASKKGVSQNNPNAIHQQQQFATTTTAASTSCGTTTTTKTSTSTGVPTLFTTDDTFTEVASKKGLSQNDPTPIMQQQQHLATAK